MRIKLSGAIVITIGAALALHATVDAQRSGGAAPVRFPSQAQFEASAVAQSPLLYGRERAARYWSMMLECAEARVIALEEGAKRRS